jgi:hypothetical protein
MVVILRIFVAIPLVIRAAPQVLDRKVCPQKPPPCSVVRLLRLMWKSASIALLASLFLPNSAGFGFGQVSGE